MKLGLLLGSLLFAPVCLGEKLKYYSPKPEFQVEFTGKVVSLKTQGHHLRIAVTKCNGQWVAEFWEGVKAAVDRYPTVTVKPSGPYAELNGRRHKVIFHFGGNELTRIPQYFLNLMSMDQRKCKS